MKDVTISNKQIFTEIIKQKEYAVGALILLYSYQTADEQMVGGTKYQNGAGFNGADSTFCSSLAEQYNSKGKLTRKQIAALQRLLPKYHGQIKVLSPLPLKTLRKRINKPAKKTIQEKVVKLKGETLIISFPYDITTIGQVKLLSGRKWDRANKVWTAPISMDNIEDLLSYGFDLDSDIKKWRDEQTKPVEHIKSIPGIRANLYPYQLDGVSFIQAKEGRAIIGDEMGLGKTIQALSWLQLNKDKDVFPALVVCPSSLKLNWAREALKFTDLEPAIISGKKKKKIETFPGGRNPQLFVINYDIIHETVVCENCSGKGTIANGYVKCKECNGKGKINKLNSWLSDFNFKSVIFDECHYTKNSKAGRTVAALELSKSCKHVIGLSGTPIVNRPIEFFNIINMVNDKIFPSWWKFTGRYCNRTNNGFGVDVSGSSNTEELHKKLSKTVMLRRLKKDVLKELPPKTRTIVPIQIDQAKYDSIIQQTKIELKDNSAAHLSIIEKAKQTVVGLKMKSSLDWIQDYIDNDEKLVVFADHRSVIEEIHNRFKNESVVVYGGVSVEERQQAVDRFQNDPTCKIFIGSKAAKEGLTLTAAKATCFLELWWTPGDHDQAEDRVHRIGQKSENVVAYYLLADNTIEMDIAELLDSKREVLSSVLDGKEVDEKGMLIELMKRINGEQK